jgi:hypothetical protein
VAARHPAARPVGSDRPAADIRIGYARCSSLTQELQSQLDALEAHGIPREKISTWVKVRPQFEAALTLARQIKAHAPHCRVILKVWTDPHLVMLPDSAEWLYIRLSHSRARYAVPGDPRLIAGIVFMRMQSVTELGPIASTL